MPEFLKRLLLMLASIVATLLALELGLRAVTWGYLFSWPNFVADARTVLAERYGKRFVHDDRLGYVPRAGYSGPGDTAAVNIEPDSLRRTGGVLSEAPILAVGDSFTFGDEVKDGETWPAELERLMGRQVLNGGVSGYGFDQIVLRAEQLAEKYKPSAIVVSFIADDIRRTEMRRLWFGDKPYFVPSGDQLKLSGVPVPERADPRTALSFWQKTLGYSYLFDVILRRLDLLHDWFGDYIRVHWFEDYIRVHAPGSGEAITCSLTQRLAELQKSGAKVILIAEYDPFVWDAPALQRRLNGGLLACAQKNDLITIDSFPALQATAKPRDLYVVHHMNQTGNRLIAKLVADKLS
jgi:GDSL-like Lipase/Acylhydrolase family